jgi:hypothetical protein
MIIYIILILLLCIIYKVKLSPDAYFNHVNFAVLFFGNLVLALQLVSFCVMNAQIFEVNVRAIVGTAIIFFLSTYIHSTLIQSPAGLQYFFIFISPFIASRSIFQVSTEVLPWFECTT